MELVSEEVPHGVGVEVISFKNREDKDILNIQANIYCERKPGILIGKGAECSRKSVVWQRVEIERLLVQRSFGAMGKG